MLKNYFKITFRHFWKNKTYSLLNVLGLALGLAGGLLIFIFVNFHLSTNTVFTHADRIYRVVLDIQSEDGSVDHEPGVSIAIADALASDYASVEKAAVCLFFYAPPTLSILRSGRQREYVESSGVAYGNVDFLQMFDISFVAGDKQTALKEPNSVVLTERQAQKYFGKTSALGKTLNINQTTNLVVTGIIEDYPDNTDLKVDVLLSLPTLKILQPNYQLQNFSWFGPNSWIFVQLAQEYNASTLEHQLSNFRQKYLGEDFNHWHFHLQPLSTLHFDERYGGTIRKSLLWTLSGIGIFLILIACINFINLSTAQATRRIKEVGVRKTMGSTQQQLFWQFMVETSTITIIATGLALVTVLLFLPHLNTWIQSDLSFQFSVDASSCVLLISLIMVVIFLAGSYPALMLSGFNPMKALKNRPMANTTTGLSVRQILVFIQFAISQIFAVGALAVVYQLNFFSQSDMGFIQDTMITVSLPKNSLGQAETFQRSLLQFSDIQAVSLQHRPPIANNNEGGFIKFNHRKNQEPFMVRDRWADTHYLETYGLKLVAGRNMLDRDSTTEILVNEEFVKRLGIDDPEEVLGKAMYADNTNVSGTIVGVTKNFHHRSLQNHIEPLAIYAYPSLFRQVGIKLNGQNISQTLQDIQTAWAQTFPNHTFDFAFLDETIARMYEQERTIARLIWLFAGIALVICALGLYGLVSFTAAQKTKEIGIRKVLGASVSSILFLLSKDYIKLILIALLIAVPVANYFITEWLQGFAYRIAIEWWLFALPGALVLLIALLSVSGQTLKAARQNPVDSLRSE